MTVLFQRVRDYFDSPNLWQVAPLGLVAGCAGVVLGVVIGLPGVASTGLGMVLGGLSINITSSVIDKLMHPETRERDRIRLIQEALQQGDPDVQALVAVLLTHNGADVSQALPADERDDLIATLDRGLHAAGGPLERIAPRYTAALRNAQTDWAAVQATLMPQIEATSQEMRAQNIRDTKQEVHERQGTIAQRMDAQQDIVGARQVVTGRRHAAPPPAPPPAPHQMGAARERPADPTDRQHELEADIRATYNLMQQYEEQVRLEHDPGLRESATRTLERQRANIAQQLAAYARLCQGQPDEEIAQIASILGIEL